MPEPVKRGPPHHDHPLPTVDVIIEFEGGVVLIERRFPPAGWAIPGGFLETGECAELGALREAKEETGLDVELQELLGVYSDPQRDPRGATIGTVYVGTGSGTLAADDDAADARVFRLDALPDAIAFDHRLILEDYGRWKQSGLRPPPRPRRLSRR